MKRLATKILILINLIAALALCCAYLANVVDPAKIWQFSFFGLAYQFLLLINLCFLILWLWRKKRIVLLSLVCILIGFGNIGRYFQLNLKNSKDLSEETVKVLTYNVRVFNHFEWEKGESVRDSILSFLHSENADIICMQEFLTRTDRHIQSEKHVKEELENTPYSHVNYIRKSNYGVTRFGLATFSKYPIIKRSVIMFENSSNSCIYTDVVKGKDTLRVFNIHLQSIRLKKDNYEVMDSLFTFNSNKIDDVKAISISLRQAFIKRSEQVQDIVKHISDSPYPVILCGDFNDTPVSYSYHQLLGEKKDAFREAGSGLSRTYRGQLPSYRIDYIFCSEGIVPKTYSTSKIKYSDHYPVTSHLDLSDL